MHNNDNQIFYLNKIYLQGIKIFNSYLEGIRNLYKILRCTLLTIKTFQDMMPKAFPGSQFGIPKGVWETTLTQDYQNSSAICCSLHPAAIMKPVASLKGTVKMIWQGPGTALQDRMLILFASKASFQWKAKGRTSYQERDRRCYRNTDIYCTFTTINDNTVKIKNV